MIKREVEEGVTAAKTELLADVGSVLFHGMDADEQILADFFAGFVLCDQSQYLLFGGSKAV